LDNAFGIEPPPNGRIIRNLILGSNYIQSHILHFFHLAALDFVQGPDVPPFVPRYQGDYRLPADVNQLAVNSYLEALNMRRKAHEMTALWGGRMPHQQAIADWFDIGRGCMNMLVYGAFPQEEGMDHIKKKKFFPSGAYVRGQYKELEPDKITEQVKYSWFKDGIAGTPDKAVIEPDVTKKDAYSFLKAPRYNGEVMEVGPLARAIVSKQPDVIALGDKAFSVMGRHFARAVECSAVAHAMKDWALKLEAGQPVATPHKIPASAQGMGLTEAARGALGHWNRIEHQRTAVYNAIVPSTWNMSPRDDNGKMGAMEQALIGTPVADTKNPIEVVRVIRSFDPCLACAIHIMTPDKKVISQFQIN
jgi:hydrogenase large subunit